MPVLRWDDGKPNPISLKNWLRRREMKWQSRALYRQRMVKRRPLSGQWDAPAIEGLERG